VIGSAARHDLRLSSGGEVVLWLARGEDALPADPAWLTAGEAAHAAGLRYTKRRTEFLLRRLAAKHAVAAAVGVPA
jgi:4'-phosphopantetheinyl transferase